MFEYFEKNNPNIAEKLIKDQGDEACQHLISKHYIHLQNNEYDFGFISKSNIAQIGQTRSKRVSQNVRLSSFILCKSYPDFELIDITLICSRYNSKHGKQLIDLVTNKAIEMNCKYLSLLSIGNIRIVNWYKSQGFTPLKI